ncbi:hypothetical protein V6N12_067921 [Hibiscus sabdariffa]|uniref:Uncharacterized protein n=1 Tax=Hibiscus sabdariffa TaxID=183260 RepID=A0ABR2FNG8_9ROSI
MQFISTTHGLDTSGFEHQGDDYKAKAREMNRSWKTIYKVEVYEDSSSFIPGYEQWRISRVNYTIPHANRIRDGLGSTIKELTVKLMKAKKRIDSYARKYEAIKKQVKKKTRELEIVAQELNRSQDQN